MSVIWFLHQPLISQGNHEIIGVNRRNFQSFWFCLFVCFSYQASFKPMVKDKDEC